MGSVLSMVVPIYNVAPYLPECLTSIAAQTHRDLEVVLIDDGSTDDSAAVAARFAESDDRFRLIRQPNRGLGAARNAGVQHASGDYLMFVDSDDVLPTYGAEVLLTSVERTGSDFAAGNVYRLNGKGLSPSRLHQAPFARTALRTHVSKRPKLLSDRTAWNKVYRRQFWDAHQLRFPEGVLYEDIPVTVPAHVLATSVDVLDIPIYYWREREGASQSITQRRTELKGFVDRVAGVDWVSRFLAENNQPKVKRAYDASALIGDLMIFMRVLLDADEEFRLRFIEECNDFLDRVDAGVVDSLPARQRVLWRLVRARKLPDLLTALQALQQEQATTDPVVRRGLKRYYALPYLDENHPDLPRELYLADPPAPQGAVHEVSVTGGRLYVRGHAYLPGVPAARRVDGLRMLWLHNSGRRTVPVLTRPRRCPDATAESDVATCSYDWSGFEAAVNLRALRDKDGRWGEGDWTVTVGVVGPGQATRGKFRVDGDLRMLDAKPVYVDRSTRIRPVFARGVLCLRVERLAARASAVRVEEEHLVIEGEVLDGGPTAGLELQLSRVQGVPWRSYPAAVSGERFSARVPLADLPAEGPEPIVGELGDRWRVELVTGGDQDSARRVLAPARDTDLRHRLGRRELWLRALLDESLEVAMLAAGPVVTAVGWLPDGRLELRGELPGPADAAQPALRSGGFQDLELVLRVWGRKEQRVIPAEVTGHRWRVAVDPLAVNSPAGRTELRKGSWDVLCRHAASPEGTVEHLSFTGAALAQLPLRGAAAHRELVLRRGRQERTVLTISPDLDVDEQGVYAQHRLRTRVYPRARTAELREAVLFNSFTGRQYSDSPRAIHEELVARGAPLEYLWVSMDGQVALPEEGRGVRFGSRDWYEAYATCRYVVSNQHLPDWFVRRPGQVVVQTWHGTPLKRIAHDIADVRFADPKYLEKVAVETPNWSLLLSPNRFSTPILRRAFRYEGEILESGYPRNDVLCRDANWSPRSGGLVAAHTTRRDEVAARVRERLGLPAGRKVVLYAPTWRDDEYYGPGRYKLRLQLDLDAAAAALGNDHALLIRSHPNVADEIPQSGGGFVWDVSAYPDIADLLAVTDILITDYSSVMFDFASTGRPMLFFTYDLDHYRDRLRGFYVDFEAEAPGPLLATSDEVIAAIRDVEAVTARYTGAYRAFVERACDLDDGMATARVVDRMLSMRG